MAGKKSKARSKAKATIIPAVRYLRYHLTNSAEAGTETSHYIDLARDLSIVNRRLYRQGRAYHIKRVTLVSSDTPAAGNRVSVSTVPFNWVSQRAYQRAYKTWTEMNKIASSQISGDIQGTWADFKVYIDTTHRTVNIAGGLARPLDNGSNQYDLGEWEYSSMVTPDGTTGADDFNLHMLGDHLGGVGAWNSVGLIKSYGESRATVQAGSPYVPGTASDDPLVNVFDYGTAVDEVVTLLEYSNDNPPYDHDEYPGDDTNGPKPAVVCDTTIVDGRGSMPGFTAFCGLLEFEIKSPLPNDVYSILIELSPGKFRGIKAETI